MAGGGRIGNPCGRGGYIRRVAGDKPARAGVTDRDFDGGRLRVRPAGGTVRLRRRTRGAGTAVTMTPRVCRGRGGNVCGVLQASAVRTRQEWPLIMPS